MDKPNVINETFHDNFFKNAKKALSTIKQFSVQFYDIVLIFIRSLVLQISNIGLKKKLVVSPLRRIS